MKMHTKINVGLAAFAVFAMMAAVPTAQAMDAKVANDLGTMKGGYSILGSKFIGLNVENNNGDNLGSVKDIMLDSNGTVRYAAVSYGGFLGVGDKMYAVPMKAFTFKRDKDMFFDDVKLVLNVSKEQLKDDKGFDVPNYPDLNDETYRMKLDKQYNVIK